MQIFEFPVFRLDCDIIFQSYFIVDFYQWIVLHFKKIGKSLQKHREIQSCVPIASNDASIWVADFLFSWILIRVSVIVSTEIVLDMVLKPRGINWKNFLRCRCSNDGRNCLQQQQPRKELKIKDWLMTTLWDDDWHFHLQLAPYFKVEILAATWSSPRSNWSVSIFI